MTAHLTLQHAVDEAGQAPALKAGDGSQQQGEFEGYTRQAEAVRWRRGRSAGEKTMGASYACHPRLASLSRTQPWRVSPVPAAPTRRTFDAAGERGPGGQAGGAPGPCRGAVCWDGRGGEEEGKGASQRPGLRQRAAPHRPAKHLGGRRQRRGGVAQGNEAQGMLWLCAAGQTCKACRTELTIILALVCSHSCWKARESSWPRPCWQAQLPCRTAEAPQKKAASTGSAAARRLPPGGRRALSMLM